MFSKYKFSFVFLLLTLFSFSAFGQNEISRPCPSIKDFARVTIDKAGNINLVPCPGKTYLFNGQPLNLNAIGQLNGLNGYSQNFAFSTASSSPGWYSSGTTHTLNIPIASSSNTGLMTPTMFNKYETAAAGYVGLSTNGLPIWNGSTFNNSQISQSGAGYAQTLRLNAQTVVLGDALGAGNNRTVTISDVATNTLAVTGASSFSGNMSVNGTVTANAFNFPSQAANQILASPNGSAGSASFRNLVPGDIPALPASQTTTGVFNIARIPDFDAAKIITGTIDIARIGTGTKTTATFHRGDNTFSALTGSDVPNHSGALITSGQVDPARLGTGTRDGTKFLRDDGVWTATTSNFRTVSSLITNPTTLTDTQSGSIIVFFNTTLTLPANPTIGTHYIFASYSSSILTIKPNGSQAVQFNDNGSVSSLSTGSTQYSANGSGLTMSMTYIGGNLWIVTGKTGNWTFTA